MEELREQYPWQAREEQREKEEREQYQQYVKNAFKDQGRGHYDLAKLFVERADDLLRDRGELGYVLPRQSLVLAGWKKLRHRLLEGSELTVLQARNRGGWIFETMEHRYMIVLLTSSSSDGSSGAYVWPAIEEEEAISDVSISNAIYLSRGDLANLTTEDRLVIPWFNSDGARDVFPKMERQVRLSSESGWISGTHDARWDFRSSGPHGHISNSSPEPGYWRVFMTRSVDQFEINESKEFRRFVDPDDLLAEGDDVINKDGTVALDSEHPTVVFRHVSRNDDKRTIIATVLPEKEFVYCKGYIHSVDHDEETSKNELLALLAYMNSFACDWWTRRIVDRHVTSPVINNLPLPDWDEDQIDETADMAAELIRRNGTSTLPGGVEIQTETSHQNKGHSEIRSMIEGLVADGFDLGKGHYNTILDDFSEKACPRDLTDQIVDYLGESVDEPAAVEQDDD